MYRTITSEEHQKAYELALPLFPREDVALRVTMDACDYLGELEASQARRKRSTRHWKADIPQEQLLQYAVYTVSYYREIDQESPRPLLEPKYVPTREDRIVRYVKHLIWKTSLLNARSIAVGIGCLLYAYKPSEIADLLFLFDERSLRVIKMRLAQDLRERFANDSVVSPDGKSMRTIPASDNDRLIVEGALKAFTPWGTDHLEAPTPDRLKLEMLFDEKNLVSDWQRKHALICPECAGLAKLINEYNNYFTTKRLADPRGNLMLPDFGGGPDPSLERFKRRLLTDSEKMFLNERRKPSGPWAYLAEVFWLQMEDFGPMEDCLADSPIPMNHYLTTVIHNMNYQNHESDCGNEVLNTGEPIPAKLSEVFTSWTSGVAIVACGVGCLPSPPTLDLTSIGAGPPLDSGDAEPQCSTSPPWIMFWRNVCADDEHNIESRFLGLVDVFEELDFPITRRPPNGVSRPNLASDVNGYAVYIGRPFAKDELTESEWVAILDGVSWSSEITATIQVSHVLIDLNQYPLLLLTMNQAGEFRRADNLSSSGPHFFHFAGHGIESPPEPSCSFGGKHGFSRNEIDGAICVWEAKHERNHAQRRRVVHDVVKLNAEMKSPNHYDKVVPPFMNQSRPTQPFTVQGL